MDASVTDPTEVMWYWDVSAVVSPLGLFMIQFLCPGDGKGDHQVHGITTFRVESS